MQISCTRWHATSCNNAISINILGSFRQDFLELEPLELHQAKREQMHEMKACFYRRVMSSWCYAKLVDAEAASCQKTLLVL